jgi:2-polyprenyl-6-methoxyphenol hydroxylase-like FAD-dependent oxidoreductase
MMSRKILIVGAGIAGLAAAIAIAQENSSDHILILEKSDQLRADGAGIALPANAMIALERLGLVELVRAKAFRVHHSTYSNSEGNALAKGAFASTAENAEFVAIDRRELHEVLLQRLSKFPNISIKTGTMIYDMQKTLDRMSVRFPQDRELSWLERPHTFDLVIGSDGIHSSVRKYMAPETQIVDLNLAAWRFIVQTPANSKPEPNYMLDYAGRCAMLYPISETLSYIYLHVFDSTGSIGTKSITREEHLQFLKNQFQAFKAFMPQVLQQLTENQNIAIIPGRIQTLSKYCCYQPAKGPIVLIGDAAHAKSPITQQGAAQALWDAVYLAQALHSPNITKALQAFKTFRTSRITHNMAIANGWLASLVEDNHGQKVKESLEDLKTKGPHNIRAWKELFAKYPDEVTPPTQPLLRAAL